MKELYVPGWWWVLVWLLVGGPPLMWWSAWFSAAPSSARAACLAADRDMLPSAGAAPAVTLTTPAGEREQVHQQLRAATSQHGELYSYI